MLRETEPVFSSDGVCVVVSRWFPSPTCAMCGRPIVGGSGRCISCLPPVKIVIIDEAHFAPKLCLEESSMERLRQDPLAHFFFSPLSREAAIWHRCFRWQCLPVGAWIPHIFEFKKPEKITLVYRFMTIDITTGRNVCIRCNKSWCTGCFRAFIGDPGIKITPF